MTKPSSRGNGYFSRKRRVFTAVWVALLAGNGVLAHAQAQYTVQASFDSTAVPELFTTIPIGFTFEFPDGSHAATRGFLHGRMRWNELQVTTAQGEVRNGQLTYDPQKVWQNQHEVTFRIQTRDTVLTCSLPLPYVESLRFNLYTDSLKRDNPFYLNVEGRFSSGRVYPLDTGMVAFRKEGGGSLEGNVVTVTRDEPEVHSIKVFAWLKLDPALKDSAMIPVKILPDPSTLPTEQQLLDQWKKKQH